MDLLTEMYAAVYNRQELRRKKAVLSVKVIKGTRASSLMAHTATVAGPAKHDCPATFKNYFSFSH